MISAAPPTSGNLPAEPNSFIGRERDLAELALAARRCPRADPVRARRHRQDPAGPAAGLRAGAGFPRRGLAGGAGGHGWTRRSCRGGSPPRSGSGRSRTGRCPRRWPRRYGPRQLLLILDTCEHIVDGLRRAGAAAAGRLPVAAGDRDQPGAAAGARRDRVAGPAAVPLPAALDPLSLADLARHEAVRLFAERAAAVRAGFDAGRGQRGGGGPAVPDAGRHAAGHRAGRGAGAGAVGGADRQPARRPVPAARLRATGPPRPASRPCGPRWTGVTSCSPSRSRSCSGGWRCSRAGTWTWPSRSARTSGSRPRRAGPDWPRSSTSRWSPSTTRCAVRPATGCWTRSGSTRAAGSPPPAKRPTPARPAP